MTSGAGGSFKYDAANNPTEVAGTTQKFDEGSELSEASTTKYAYDKLGERTEAKPGSGPVTKYGYDQAHNLVSVTRKEEGEVKKIEDTYGYNGTGLRMSETINGSTNHMAWDTSGGLPLLLYDGTNYYLYGPDGTTFEQIASETPTYLHHDQQGSTRLLTNSEGKGAGKYTYTPYGAVEGHEGTASTPLGFDGQYRSEDTGLIYLRARVYDPSTAQFMSVDPLVSTTDEAYSYVVDSPVNGGDPEGLCQKAANPPWKTALCGFLKGVDHRAGNYIKDLKLNLDGAFAAMERKRFELNQIPADAPIRRGIAQAAYDAAVAIHMRANEKYYSALTSRAKLQEAIILL